MKKIIPSNDAKCLPGLCDVVVVLVSQVAAPGLQGRDCTSLDKELVHTNQAADVTSWHVLDSLDTAAHHENCPLLRKKIISLNVV